MIALVTMTVAAHAQTSDRLYYDGKELYDSQDYHEAYPLLLKAAVKGHKKAQYRVGRCYDKAHGVARNYKRPTTGICGRPSRAPAKPCIRLASATSRVKVW